MLLLHCVRALRVFNLLSATSSNAMRILNHNVALHVISRVPRSGTCRRPLFRSYYSVMLPHRPGLLYTGLPFTSVTLLPRVRSRVRLYKHFQWMGTS